MGPVILRFQDRLLLPAQLGRVGAARREGAAASLHL
jgi:hypothetical protein